jgi:hypothetical protein
MSSHQGQWASAKAKHGSIHIQARRYSMAAYYMCKFCELRRSLGSWVYAFEVPVPGWQLKTSSRTTSKIYSLIYKWSWAMEQMLYNIIFWR